MDTADYLRRSGDEELGQGTLEENINGFCIWRTHKDALVLCSVYGNGKYWDSWVEDKAKALGKKRIVFGTKRNPEAIKRKYNCEIIGYILERKV